MIEGHRWRHQSSQVHDYAYPPRILTYDHWNPQGKEVPISFREQYKILTLSQIFYWKITDNLD